MNDGQEKREVEANFRDLQVEQEKTRRVAHEQWAFTVRFGFLLVFLFSLAWLIQVYGG